MVLFSGVSSAQYAGLRKTGMDILDLNLVERGSFFLKLYLFF